MYSIVSVIVGTYVKDHNATSQALALDKLAQMGTEAFLAEFATEPEPGEEPVTAEELIEGWTYEATDFDDEPWKVYYHGGADYPPVAVGVEIDGFDETENQVASEIRLTPTDEETAQARAVYDALPEIVRASMPPFGVYLVWHTS